ncbi:PLAC8-domain-containing protein [Polyplosphaeria fusca]|uniref:PLAC8-domain-containing protein n=1 Tax=Polyplosphaeria fusca TaxID=682080 RepID=A0A9P4RBN6_9PLEO|nr:PLAC8-domain-containing protein [Polyplosphaeria fusca]
MSSINPATILPTTSSTVLSTTSHTVLPTTSPTVLPTTSPTVLPTTSPTVPSTTSPTVLPTTTSTILPATAPTTPTVIATTSPNWTHGLYHCCSTPSLCLGAWCCPCMIYGRTKYRLSHDNDMSEFSTLNTHCLLWYLLCLLPGCWQGVLNTRQIGKVRKRYGIEGSYYRDWLQMYCCGPLAMVRVEREVKEREQMKKVVKEQYKGEVMTMKGVLDKEPIP